MRRKNRNLETPPSEGAPEWMVTYSDMVTLLLCFFVLLFSMAVIDKQKFIEVANSLRSSFQHTQSGGNMFDTNQGNTFIDFFDKSTSTNTGINNNETTVYEEQKISEIVDRLNAAIESQNLENHITIIEEKEFVTLRFDSLVLFDSAKADILESGKEVLIKMGEILKEVDNEILVQGHTDNLPISTLLFPSNWELSTKRATNVVLFLVEHTGIKPEILTASGNGEFKPIVPNDTEVNRQKNRRVDFVILK